MSCLIDTLYKTWCLNSLGNTRGERVTILNLFLKHNRTVTQVLLLAPFAEKGSL